MSEYDLDDQERDTCERAFVAAFESGEAFSREFLDDWCENNSVTTPSSFSIDASLIRDAILVESALAYGHSIPSNSLQSLTELGFERTEPLSHRWFSIHWGDPIPSVPILQSDIEDLPTESATFLNKINKNTLEELVAVQFLQIIGTLDLSQRDIPLFIDFHGVFFVSPNGHAGIDASSCHLKSINMQNSYLEYFSFFRSKITDGISISHSRILSLYMEYININGFLKISESFFYNEIDLDECYIKNDLEIRDCIIFDGVILSGAVVSRGIYFSDSIFISQSETCISFNGLETDSSIWLSNINCYGEVSVYGVIVKGHLGLTGTTIQSHENCAALDASDSVIDGNLIFNDPDELIDSIGPVFIYGDIKLINASCNVLHDGNIKEKPLPANYRIPENGCLYVDGFEYRRIGNQSASTWSQRKEWLERQSDADKKGKHFKPQPYEQLAKVLREMGHSQDAHQALLSKQWRIHTSGNLPILSSVFRWLVFWPTGYGYLPGIPAALGVLLMLTSTFITGTAYRLGYMTPAQPHAALAAISAELGTTPPDVEDCLLADATETVPPFNAGAYVIDAFIPLVDIDQESSWKPARAPRCDGRYTALAPLDEINPGWFTTSYQLNWWQRSVSALAQAGGLHWLQWILMISGFAISALIAASLSGLIRRD